MSDELDIAFDQTTCIMGSTDITVDQVGSGGSTAMERDSWPMRRVAAEARRVLLDMASVRLGVPAAQLAVSNAVITAQADPSKRVTYGELIAGKKFNVTLTGNNINSVTGQAKTKSVPELQYTGQPLQRDDIPAKVDGSLKWAVDVKLPGMVHARNVKPPFACATLTGIDESSVKKPAGFHQGREQGQLRRRGLRARRAGHPRRPPAEDDVEEAGQSSVPAVRQAVRLHAHGGARGASEADRGGKSRCRIFRRGDDRSRPSTKCRSRVTPRSPAPMRQRTRRTDR